MLFMWFPPSILQKSSNPSWGTACFSAKVSTVSWCQSCLHTSRRGSAHHNTAASVYTLPEVLRTGCHRVRDAELLVQQWKISPGSRIPTLRREGRSVIRAAGEECNVEDALASIGSIGNMVSSAASGFGPLVEIVSNHQFLKKYPCRFETATRIDQNRAARDEFVE